VYTTEMAEASESDAAAIFLFRPGRARPAALKGRGAAGKAAAGSRPGRKIPFLWKPEEEYLTIYSLA
jgi:hypothetical protein